MQRTAYFNEMYTNTSQVVQKKWSLTIFIQWSYPLPNAECQWPVENAFGTVAQSQAQLKLVLFCDMLHSRVLHWSASGCFAGDSLLGHSCNNGFLLLSNNTYVECLVHKNSLNSWTKTKFTNVQLEPHFFLCHDTYSQTVWMVHKPGMIFGHIEYFMCA